MKKLISLTLALMLVFSLATVANAGISPTPTIKKEYTLVNPGMTSPAEDLQFSVKAEGVYMTDNWTTADLPLLEVWDVTIDEQYQDNDGKVVGIQLPEGAAGNGATHELRLAVPDELFYEAGIYVYSLTEIGAPYAGVTYYNKPIYVVWNTYIGYNSDGSTNWNWSVAVHVDDTYTWDATNNKLVWTKNEKADTIVNEYAAGDLTISKMIEGNFADSDKKFEFTVTFEAPKDANGNYLAVGAPITAGNIVINPADWQNGKASKDFELAHREEITFTNIPYGVTYTVTETTYNDYEQSYKLNGANAVEATTASDEMDSAAESVEFINKKDSTPDTGITLDSIPFILILAVCAGAVVLFVVKRRRNVDF